MYTAWPQDSIKVNATNKHESTEDKSSKKNFSSPACICAIMHSKNCDLVDAWAKMAWKNKQGKNTLQRLFSLLVVY